MPSEACSPVSTRSALDQAHHYYVHSDTVLEDHPEPISSRFAEIAEAAPELVRRKFYEDCDDLFEGAYKGASGERLTAYLNWAHLQRHFWFYLYGNDMLAASALGIKVNMLNLWIERIFRRHEGMKPWRRGGKNESRILKPRLGDHNKLEADILHS